MYIAINGLKPKNFFSKLRFWFLAIPSFRAAQKAEGNIFCETKAFNGYQHTLTAWKDRKLMVKYLNGAEHSKAMRNFRAIATGSTYGYESEHIPNWDEALDLWNKNFKEY